MIQDVQIIINRLINQAIQASKSSCKSIFSLVREFVCGFISLGTHPALMGFVKSILHVIGIGLTKDQG